MGGGGKGRVRKLGHAAEGLGFNAFGGGDEAGGGGKVGLSRRKDSGEVAGRHDGEGPGSGRELRRDVDVGGQGEAGQVAGVFARMVERGREVGIVHPKVDGVEAWGQRNGERGAPTAAPEDGDYLRRHSKRFSLPARRRVMLAE